MVQLLEVKAKINFNNPSTDDKTKNVSSLTDLLSKSEHYTEKEMLTLSDDTSSSFLLPSLVSNTDYNKKNNAIQNTIIKTRLREY